MNAEVVDAAAVIPTAEVDDNFTSNHQDICFTMNPALIHLFDAETEQNLL